MRERERRERRERVRRERIRRERRKRRVRERENKRKEREGVSVGDGPAKGLQMEDPMNYCERAILDQILNHVLRTILTAASLLELYTTPYIHE